MYEKYLTIKSRYVMKISNSIKIIIGSAAIGFALGVLISCNVDIKMIVFPILFGLGGAGIALAHKRRSDREKSQNSIALKINVNNSYGSFEMTR